MSKSSEVEMLESICEEAKNHGKITGNHLTKLTYAFGSRFSKAWTAVLEERVKKYTFKPGGRIVWIVVGKERDYIVMPTVDFCSCDDFYFRVMDKEVHLCYHLIAQKLAEALKWYDLIEESDELYNSFMEEWRKVIP